MAHCNRRLETEQPPVTDTYVRVSFHIYVPIDIGFTTRVLRPSNNLSTHQTLKFKLVINRLTPRRVGVKFLRTPNLNVHDNNLKPLARACPFDQVGHLRS